jgi:diguanylate cyclase (GGDEF)-like protein/PAS domain S-box-containing protein
MLADYSHDVVVRMRADGQRLYVSPSAKDILGWEPDELLTSRWELVHPDDRAMQREAMARLFASGEPNTAIYRLRHKDGHYIWIEAVSRLLPSEEEEGTMDIMYSGRDVSLRIAAEQALLASQRELETLARVDSLTGLPNRRQFDERLALAVARSQRPGLPIALLYLDIDHFKQINDTHGHGIGDQVLHVFGKRLVGCVRAGDLAARLGGDEFVVLVEDALLPQAAEIIARKLIATMDVDIVADGIHVRATTSVGIAYCPFRTSAEVLMAAADAALYDAKKAGRNTCRLVTVEGPPKQ